MLRLVPLVTRHVPPLPTASVTFAVMASQSFGLLTVILPAATHALSVKPVSLATIVYVNVALPFRSLTSVLSALFVIIEAYVRVKVERAVLLTVRSAPTQTLTLWLADPVVPVFVVIVVAVFWLFVVVPASSPEFFGELLDLRLVEVCEGDHR